VQARRRLRDAEICIVQLDGEAAVDLSAYTLDATDTTGFAGMHYSFEFSASTGTRRWVNIANVIGTMED